MAFQKNSFQKKPHNVHLILVLVVNSSFRLPCPRSRPFWNPGILYIFYGTDKENLHDYQEHPKMVIISFILMTLICDSAGVL